MIFAVEIVIELSDSGDILIIELTRFHDTLNIGHDKRKYSKMASKAAINYDFVYSD